MSAKHRIVELFLFASPQINFIVFFIKNKRFLLIGLMLQNWFRLQKFSRFEALTQKIRANVDCVALKALLVSKLTGICKKSRLLPRSGSLNEIRLKKFKKISIC